MVIHMNTMTKKMKAVLGRTGIFLIFMLLAGCAFFGRGDQYRDQNMDFGSIRTVAVMPLANLSRDQVAADRVRDVLSNMLLGTGGVYVVPPGEVARGIARVGIMTPVTPSTEEIQKFATIIKADAVITGAVKEYGEVRSGSSSANVISLSLQMVESQTGRVVWSSSTTEGGITAWDRLFGGGGKPMNETTEKAVNDLIEKLFK
jgi:hypothetical protein